MKVLHLFPLEAKRLQRTRGVRLMGRRTGLAESGEFVELRTHDDEPLMIGYVVRVKPDMEGPLVGLWVLEAFWLGFPAAA